MRNKILYSVFVIVVLGLAMVPVVFGEQDERAAQRVELGARIGF
jgi:hypothetical protein